LKDTQDGGEFGAFLNGIPYELGDPVGPLPEKGHPLLHRTFQHGEIFANTGTGAQRITLPKSSRAFVGDQAIDITASQAFNLEPMKAAIIIRKP
jgi:hypothetical protein